ncbi:MFS transporter [Bacillus sp. A301a_S52]|nr:MFS transporter [Bacillus sp. A301a_S52]
MNIFHVDRAIQIRLCLQFLTTIGTMSVLPYIIVYFSSMLGRVTTGMMFIGVMIASVIGTLCGGFWADKVGRKKVILLAESVVAVGFLAVAFVNSAWLTLPYITFVLYLFIQFSTGAAEPVYQALIIDASTPGERRTIYTLSYWLRNLATAIGGIAGAFLFANHHFYLFLGVASCTCVSIIVTASCIRETHVPEKKVRSRGNLPNFKGNKRGLILFKRLAGHRLFMVFVGAHLLIVSLEEQLTNVIGIRFVHDMTTSQAVAPFIPLDVDGTQLIGLLKSQNTLIIVCLTAIIVSIIKRLNERVVLVTGLTMYAAGYVILSHSDVVFILLIAMTFASIGEIMYLPTKQVLLANMIPDQARSTFLGFYMFFTYAGVASAGGFIMLSEWVGAGMLTVIFSFMGLIAIVLMNHVFVRAITTAEDKGEEERVAQ